MLERMFDAARDADHALARPGPASPPEARRLVAQARRLARDAAASTDPADRFGLAHLAALRTAAAVVASRARPGTGPRRLRSAWVLLDAAAPELSDWSAYFANAAPTRAALDTGAVRVVSQRLADEQLRAAAEFLALAERVLGTIASPLAS
jgi:SAV_6107-like HEPN